MKPTKRNIKKYLGLKTDAALARYFDLSRAAPNLWKEDEEIPGTHLLTLIKNRPDAAKKFLWTPKQ